MSCSSISDAAAMRAVAMKNVHIAEEAPAEMEARISGALVFLASHLVFFDPPPCLFDPPLVFFCPPVI